jgi:hypothetical protein
MGLDTKTHRLTVSRNVTLTLQSTHRPFGPVLNQSPPATSRYYITSTRQQQGYVSSDRRPARGSTTCRTCTSLDGRCKSPVPISEALHSRPPQHTGNPMQRSSADYPLAAHRTKPVAVRAAPGNLPYTLRPFSGPPSTIPTNQRGPRRRPPHSIQNGPFQGQRLKQCRYCA